MTCWDKKKRRGVCLSNIMYRGSMSDDCRECHFFCESGFNHNILLNRNEKVTPSCTIEAAYAYLNNGSTHLLYYNKLLNNVPRFSMSWKWTKGHFLWENLKNKLWTQKILVICRDFQPCVVESPCFSQSLGNLDISSTPFISIDLNKTDFNHYRKAREICFDSCF